MRSSQHSSFLDHLFYLHVARLDLYYLVPFLATLTCKLALNGLYCADVPLSNYSVTDSTFNSTSTE